MTATSETRVPPPVLQRGLEPALEARDVIYRYPQDRGLHGLTLSLGRGAVLGLIGPNGSGKSTLLSVISGLVEPQSGSISVLGGSPRSVAGRLGWVFQEPSLDPRLTVAETLDLSRRLYRSEAATASEALAVVGLNDRASDRVAVLSGGMKRRLELARAIQHSPELLVMDEPTLGLDLDSRRAIWKYLAELNAGGLTIIVATNDVSEAESVCSEVAFLRDGRLIAQAAPAALKEGLAEQSLQLRWPGLSDGDFAELQRTPGVSSATRAGETVRLTTRDSHPLLAVIAGLGSGRIESITIRDSSLEDAYFELAGAPLISEDGAR